MCASRYCVKASAEYSITFNLVIPENKSPGVMALRFLNLSKGALLLSVHLSKFYHESPDKSMHKGFYAPIFVKSEGITSKV